MSKQDDVLRAMVHDYVTLTDEDVNKTFEASRKSLEKVRQEKGLQPYSEEDWKFIRNFYELFYRDGFADAARRFKNMLDQIIDGHRSAPAPEVSVLCVSPKAMS